MIKRGREQKGIRNKQIKEQGDKRELNKNRYFKQRASCKKG